jgi:hypothetical protein
MKRAQFTSQQKEKSVAYALAHPDLPLKKIDEDVGKARTLKWNAKCF